MSIIRTAFRVTMRLSRQMGTRAFSIWAVIVFCVFPGYALSRVSTALSTVCLDNNGQHEGGRFSMPQRTTVLLLLSYADAGLLFQTLSELSDDRLAATLDTLKVALAHDPIVSNQRIGSLTVIGPAPKKRYRPFWWCSCDCGAIKEIAERSLREGTRSCGCLSIKHGLAGTPEYRIWGAMLQRCHNPNSISYYNYGARGIFVCKEWREDFGAFYKYVSSRPSPELTLERIDNNKGYEPGNVKWATRGEQNRNKRGVRLVTYEDRTQCLTDWANDIDLSSSALAFRLDNHSIEHAMTAPRRKREKS